MLNTRQLATLVLLLPAVASAQGTMADYQRAQALQKRYSPLVVDSPDAPVWITGTSKFWYRKTVKGGGTAAVVVDAATLEKRPATSADTMSTGGGRGGRGGGGGRAAAAADATRLSPDGKLLAYIDNFNIAVRPAGSTEGTRVSTDGSEGNPYNFQSIAWSPDSRMIAAYRVRPGYRRMVRYVESSPTDQLQPKTFERYYQKPGDVLDLQQPSFFDVASKRETAVDNALSEPLRSLADRMEEGQSCVHVRVQPARTPGVQRARSRRVDWKSPFDDDGDVEDIHRLSPGERRPRRLRAPVPLRSRRWERVHLDVRARRLGTPLHG